MKKQFKKSYRLGITAGLLTGVFVTLLLAPFFPAYIEVMKAPVSFLTLLLASLLMLTSASVLMGIIFVSLINVIPSNNIVLKFYIFDIILSILTSPAFLLVEMPALPFYMYAIQFFICLVLYPLIYSACYLFIAKKLPGITKFNRLGFVFIIGAIVSTLLILVIASIGVDTYKLLSKPEIISGLNQSGMENEVFDRINQKRIALGNEPLIWSDDIHKIARNYSLEITGTSIFSLFSVYNKTVADRFEEQGLFFQAVDENLYLGPLKSNSDFARSSFDKWMSKPAQRANIVDEYNEYSHAAVGVSCNSVVCSAVMYFSDFDMEGTFTLEPGEYDYASLNDASWGLEDGHPIYIRVNSTGNFDVYFFDKKEDMELFVEYDEDKSTYKKLNVKDFGIQWSAHRDSYNAVFSNSTNPLIIDYRLTYNYDQNERKN